MKGNLVVLYGVNNIGKTTQQELLLKALGEQGHQVVERKSPNYDLASGTLINSLLRSGEQKVPPAELQLWMAVNMHQDKPPISALLDEGKTVILEDYWGTTLAWGLAHGVPREKLDTMVTGLPAPDIAILLDGERFLESKEEGHIHESDDELAGRVVGHLKNLAKEYRWDVVTANQPIDKVHQDIIKVVQTKVAA